ncbi:MAG: helix-turn-helix domain-containing protein [Opitutales bacterium]
MNSATIAVASDLNFRHTGEIYRGIVDHSTGRALDWRLVPLHFGFEADVRKMIQEGVLDGIIGTFVSDRWLADLREKGVRAINLFRMSAIHTVPTVGVDDAAIGQAAALHLIRQGCVRFAFLGPGGMHAVEERKRGYCEALERHCALGEASCMTLKTSPDFGRHPNPLLSVEKPLGIFCSSDRLARELITTLEPPRSGIGQDILVVGVDNDPAESVFACIGISSFSLPCYDCGKLAAGLLEAELAGERVPPRYHAVDGCNLQIRESSLRRGSSGLAERTSACLREHLEDPGLSMDQVARMAGGSRRSVELAFRRHFGESPYRWLNRMRMEKAARLLRETELKIMEVGARCGLPRQHHFSAAFKRFSGHSPTAYRQSP